MNEVIGFIAGESVLPRLAVRQARGEGRQTVVAGIRGLTRPEVGRLADRYREFSLGQLGGVIRFFKANRVRQAVMVGRVGHPSIFTLLTADRHFYTLLKRIKNKTTTALLSVLADFFLQHGIEIIDSSSFLSDYLARERDYTPVVKPDRNIIADIEFGWEKAWGIAALDIGQTVCVKNRAVVAVEAMEGTDQTIRRAAAMAGPGLVVVKVSRPGGEMRFDIPVIGLGTIKTMQKARAAALVVEADRTLMLDAQKLIGLASKSGIAVRARRGQ